MYSNAISNHYNINISPLEIRIKRILKHLGIRMPDAGSTYLVISIRETYYDPSVAEFVTKTLIPHVGKICHNSGLLHIHRSMLRSISVLKHDPDRQAMKKHFGTETPKINIANIVRGIAKYLHREDEEK